MQSKVGEHITADMVRIIDAAKDSVVKLDDFCDVKTIKADEKTRSVSSDQVDMEWLLIGRNESRAGLLDIFLFNYRNCIRSDRPNKEKFKAGIECLLTYLETNFQQGGAVTRLKLTF